MTPFSLPRRRSRAGFALASAIAVVLLFAFAAAFTFLLIREGDRKVERFRGERSSIQLAESALALMMRKAEKTGEGGALPELELNGGKANGTATKNPDESWTLEASGVQPIPGGESARAEVVVTGTVNPFTKRFETTLWRWKR